MFSPLLFFSGVKNGKRGWKHARRIYAKSRGPICTGRFLVGGLFSRGVPGLCMSKLEYRLS